MDTFAVSVCPLEPTPFLSPLLQVMIPVTPMMLPLNLFGLRLPEVCGEWQGGGGGCSPHFSAFSAFSSHFPGRSLSVMFKGKHSSGIVL